MGQAQSVNGHCSHDGVVVAGRLLGAVLPLLLVFIVPRSALAWTVPGGSLLFLALLGAMAASAGGSPVWKSVARVTLWGALAMALTAGVGALFGATL